MATVSDTDLSSYRPNVYYPRYELSALVTSPDTNCSLFTTHYSFTFLIFNRIILV